METNNNKTQLITIKDEDFTSFIRLTQPSVSPCLTQFVHHSETSFAWRYILILVIMAYNIQTKMSGTVIVAS